MKNLLGREREGVTELLHNLVWSRIAGDDVPDDPRTLWDRKEDRLEDRLDATTKRHYNYDTIYEWDERKRAANLEKHGLDFASADLVFESEQKVTSVSGKGGEEMRFVDYAEIEDVLLALIHTLRDDAVRIISFRPAKRKERRVYNAAIKNR
jgi:uncharacterized DUF497 family protein